MGAFSAVSLQEFRMQLRRPALWIVSTIVCGYASYRLVVPAGGKGAPPAPPDWPAVLRAAAHRGILINMLFPIGYGVLLADRLRRDRRLRADAFLTSLGLSPSVRLWGKLAGAGGAATLVCFGYSMAASGYVAAWQGPRALLAGLLAFLAISLPALVFTGAFCVVLGDLIWRPLFLMLFVCYWFWGNLLDPQVLPSLSCTLLSPVGGNVSSGLFGGTALYAGTCSRPVVDPGAGQAVESIAVLALAATLVMLAGHMIIKRRQTRRQG
jgi:hypothetical protein